MDLVIVTGLSGAGKSRAVDCLEDIGYYCIDNMPPSMIKDFLKLSDIDNIRIEKVAFVADIRGGEFFDDMKESLSELRTNGIDFKILFLEASKETLIRRFKELRRKHPLDPEGFIETSIENEREKLSEIREMADYVIDTSNMKAAKLQETVNGIFSDGKTIENITITILSFGYKNGIPLEADFVFDLRFLPNPFYVASLKNLTGNNRKVQEYIFKHPEAQHFADTIHDMIERLVPLYAKEGKYHLTLAFGCTGGKHRSVTMANILSERFEKEGRRIIKVHRDCANQ